MQHLNYVEVDWDAVLLIKIKNLYISQDIGGLNSMYLP